MPSEQSFNDRIGRFVLLKDACETMSPAFAPADTDIALPAQIALIGTLNTCCTNVNNAANDLKDLTGPRVTLVTTIKERVTRAVNRVESNRAWASKLPGVKATADKVRNMKGNEGLNAATGEYEDLVKLGVIDAAKVTRSALQNAASIAALFLTTEVVIADKPENAAPMPGGGMEDY